MVIDRSEARDTPDEPVAVCRGRPIVGTRIAETILAGGQRDRIHRFHEGKQRRGLLRPLVSILWRIRAMTQTCGLLSHPITLDYENTLMLATEQHELGFGGTGSGSRRNKPLSREPRFC
jgi:hypothetical protein